MILGALQLSDTQQACFMAHLLSSVVELPNASFDKNQITSLSLSLAMRYQDVRGNGSIAVSMLNLRIRRKLAKNLTPK